MKTIIFDIETGPLPESQILPLMPPFEPPGNVKDPVKLAERERLYREEYIANAALSPLTGQVLCIGAMIDNDTPLFYGYDNEYDIIYFFWSFLHGVYPCKLVGFNSHLFDLPFLIRRSWINGLQPPQFLREGRYWYRDSIDLREVWQLGDRQAHGSLDSISKALGLGGKNGDGKDFAKLWKEDKEKAKEYLENDLRLTKSIYERIC